MSSFCKVILLYSKRKGQKMKLRKLQMATAALLLGATMSYASSEIYLLGGSTDIGAKSSINIYGFGYGGTNKDLSKDSQFLYGVNLEYFGGSTEFDSVKSGGNLFLKAGYRYKRVSIYALGGMVYDGFTGSTALGFGYGGSAEVDIWRFKESKKHIVLGAKYITASMENAYDFSYTSDNLSAYIKYVW